MAESSDALPELHPRDILQPIATLIGLLVAAIGFIKTSNPPAGEFQGFIILISIIIIFFVAVAIATASFFVTRKRSIWRLALGLYPFSWLVFGVGVIFILLEVAYGPITLKSLSLPKIALSNFLSGTLTVVAAIVAGIVAILTTRTDEAKLDKQISQIRSASTPTESERQEAKELITPDTDYQMAFIKVIIEIEALVRKIAQKNGIEGSDRLQLRVLVKALMDKGRIDKQTYVTIMDLWPLRNRAVHGVDLTNDVASVALQAGLEVKGKLEAVNSSPSEV